MTEKEFYFALLYCSLNDSRIRRIRLECCQGLIYVSLQWKKVKLLAYFSQVISVKDTSRLIAFDSNTEKILFCFVLTRNTLNKSWKINFILFFLAVSIKIILEKEHSTRMLRKSYFALFSLEMLWITSRIEARYPNLFCSNVCSCFFARLRYTNSLLSISPTKITHFLFHD